MRQHASRTVAVLGSLVVLLAGCAGATERASAPQPGSSPQGTATPRSTDPAELPTYFDRTFDGSGLRLGAVRERTSQYTSHDATYRGDGLRISGVLNVPVGDGPFPAVVLAHGWIDRDRYVTGQGMERERATLASNGYLALHVDYRNHASSDRDPGLKRSLYLAYAVDVINAVHALRASDEVPIDDDRIAVMGRSMGGPVMYQVLEIAPELVRAGVAYAPQSALEADN